MIQSDVNMTSSNGNFSDEIVENRTSQTIKLCETMQNSIRLDFQGPVISSIAAVAINTLAAFFSVTINLMIIIAIVRKERLRTAANLVLTSMAVSDLLVGLVVQPLKVTHIVLNLMHSTSCLVKHVNWFTGTVCIGASLFNMSFFAVDRLFATLVPYRYLEDVIYQKYLAILVLAWVFLASISALTYAKVLEDNVIQLQMTMLYCCCTVIILVSYAIIYRVVRIQRQKITRAQPKIYERETGRNEAVLSKDRRSADNSNVNAAQSETLEEVGEPFTVWRKNNELSTKTSDIVRYKRSVSPSLFVASSHAQVMEIVSTDEARSAAARCPMSDVRCQMSGAAPAAPEKERSSTALRRNTGNCTILLMATMFLVCYLPAVVLKAVNDRRLIVDSTLYVAFDWTNTLVLLNSALNPMIFCWRVSSLRKEVKKIMCRNV